jgi:DMSO reductase anchor subunit
MPYPDYEWLRRWLPWLVVVGFATGLTIALVGVKVPAVVLTMFAALPVVGLVMRRWLFTPVKDHKD